MTETFCDSGHVKLKVGANGTALTSAQYTTLINEAEAYICNTLKFNYLTTYSTLTAGLKVILEDAASSHAAIAAINHRIDDFRLSVAQTMLNINYTRLTDAMNILKTTDFGIS